MPQAANAAIAGLLVLALGGAALIPAGTWLGGWLAPVAALIGAAAALLLRRVPIGTIGQRDVTGPVLLGMAAAAILTWVLSFSSTQPSDFGVYWRCGDAARLPVLDWIEVDCQSSFLPPSTVFWRRSLFYTAPLFAPWGAGDFLLKLGNAALMLVGLFALWAGARAAAGPRFAAVALAAALSGPEAWFSLTLATPDHVAVPAVVLTLLALARILEGAERDIDWKAAVGLGIVVFVAAQARSIGPILLLAIGLAILAGKGPTWRRLATAAIALGLYLMLTAGLSWLTAGAPAFPATVLQLLAVLDLGAAANWASAYSFIQFVLPIVPEEARQGFTLSHILAEATGGAAQLPYWLLSRLRLLFDGGGYLFFATHALAENPDTVVSAAVSAPSAPGLGGLLALLPRPAVGAALIGLFLPAQTPLTLAARCWLVAFLLLVVGLGEVQQRYVTLVWPAVAILAASAVLPAQRAVPPLRGATPALAGALGFLLLLLLFAAVAPRFRPLVAFPMQGGVTPVAAEDCPPAFATIHNRSVTIRPPPEASCGALRLTLPETWREAGIAVSRTDMVFRFQQPPPFTLTYAFGEGPEETLGERMAAWHRVAPPPGRHELLLRVTRRNGHEGDLLLLLPIRLR